MKMMAATGTKFRNSTYKPGDWVVTNHKPTQTNLTRGKMKTDEKTLTAGEWLSKMRDIMPFYFDTNANPYIIELAQAYARQEVEKHLKMAAKNAKITYHTIRPDAVDKQSITGIKIELT